jgi:hypothetical protein
MALENETIYLGIALFSVILLTYHYKVLNHFWGAIIIFGMGALTILYSINATGAAIVYSPMIGTTGIGLMLTGIVLVYRSIMDALRRPENVQY